MDSIIKCENLGVAYGLGKTNEVWALKDVNMEIFPNEYVIFFGPSGCGKSTLLYTIAGLEMPSCGKVIVGGKDLTHISQEDLIKFHISSLGMIFQAYYLIPTLSVKDNILLPQMFAGASINQRNEKVNSLMQRFGMDKFKERKPSMLSGGQQQRVAIARALINEPSIILADEPMGNLDSENAQIVTKLLSELNEKDGKTIIHVTHDPRYLYQANRIFYMQDGRIVRTVVSAEKKNVTQMSAKKVSELELLSQAYPYLDEIRLRAKLILNHLLLSYDIDTQQKMEKLIDSYLRKEIDERIIFETLDKPPINLYSQTAQDLAKRVIVLAKEIEKIEESEKYPDLTPADEKAMELRGYLLDAYSGSLSFEQIKRLEEILGQRIIGRITSSKLKEFFDKPLKEGGVGLNKRTAIRFAREINLILMREN